jgi:hypothetical protein
VQWIMVSFAFKEHPQESHGLLEGWVNLWLSVGCKNTFFGTLRRKERILSMHIRELLLEHSIHPKVSITD